MKNMNYVYMIFMIIILMLIFLLTMIQFFFLNKKMNNKMNSIEAGFMSLYKSSQNSYSMQFIMLMLIFITFDLEILFISSILFKINILMMIIFTFFIFYTLLMEWFLNTLTWLV